MCLKMKAGIFINANMPLCTAPECFSGRALYGRSTQQCSTVMAAKRQVASWWGVPSRCLQGHCTGGRRCAVGKRRPQLRGSCAALRAALGRRFTGKRGRFWPRPWRSCDGIKVARSHTSCAHPPRLPCRHCLGSLKHKEVSLQYQMNASINALCGCFCLQKQCLLYAHYRLPHECNSSSHGGALDQRGLQAWHVLAKAYLGLKLFIGDHAASLHSCEM